MNTPDTKHPDYLRLRALTTLCLDFFKGTATVRAKGPLYLPQHAAEDDEDYKIRLKGSRVYNAFARAIGAIAGLAFQRDPVLGDNIGPLTRQDWENIDLQGTHGDVFARRLLIDALQTGVAGILVDQVATPAANLAEERRRNIRPYWKAIAQSQLINWRIGTLPDGRVGFTLLVLEEVVEEPKGLFGSTTVTQYRVFLQGPEDVAPRWEVWRQAAPGQPVTKDPNQQGVIVGQTTIPFALIVLEGTSLADARPPLYDLAELNHAHYMLGSDRTNLLHIAHVPILVEIGGKAAAPGKQEQPVGPGTVVRIPNPDGDLKYVEPTGSALGQSRDELNDIERRMAQVSLAFLASETRGVETAEAKRIDAAAQNATIGSVVRTLEDALELALQFHANFRKETAGELTLCREYEELQLTPELIRVLSDMVAVNQLDLDTLWELLKQGRVLPAGFDADKVKARVTVGGQAPSDAVLDTVPMRTGPAPSASLQPQ